MIEKILSLIQFKTNILVSLAAYTIEEIVDFWPRTERRKAVFFDGSRIESFCGYRVAGDFWLWAWCMMRRKSEMIQFSSLETCSSSTNTISAVIPIPFKISNRKIPIHKAFLTLFLFIHLSSTFENGAGRPVKLSHKYSGALQNISFFPLLHKSDWNIYKICMLINSYRVFWRILENHQTWGILVILQSCILYQSRDREDPRGVGRKNHTWSFRLANNWSSISACSEKRCNFFNTQNLQENQTLTQNPFSMYMILCLNTRMSTR